jgi:hypothetical protein
VTVCSIPSPVLRDVFKHPVCGTTETRSKPPHCSQTTSLRAGHTLTYEACEMQYVCYFYYDDIPTERGGQVVTTPGSYFGCPGLQSRPKDSYYG